uniref:Zinc_ribbon_6 domain-containing protein n=1 Tax=Macrostomum lignano TaxID=282301 RepID=A0A1I8GJ29_9PLAT
MYSDSTVTPRTQRRQEICQRRLDYLARNGERLLSSNGIDSSKSTNLSSPRAKENTPKAAAAPTATATIKERQVRNSQTAASGNKVRQRSAEATAQRPCISAPFNLGAAQHSDEDAAIESEFHTHRPGPEFDPDYDDEATREAGMATSRSTELLLETQRNHLQDIVQQSRISAAAAASLLQEKQNSKRPHSRSQSYQHQQPQRPTQQRAAADDTDEFLRELEARHKMRQSRRLPDYDAILRQLDSELDSVGVDVKQQQQQQAVHSSEKHLVQRQQFQQKNQKQRSAIACASVAEEWTEQRLRESNSRASLERYFASLREISPRSEASEIAQQFEPVPDYAAGDGTKGAPELIRCPECGEATDARDNLTWCPNCGRCLTVVVNDATEDKDWATVASNSSRSESGASSTVTSLPAGLSVADGLDASQHREMQRRRWQKELLSPDLLQELRLDLPPE